MKPNRPAWVPDPSDPGNYLCTIHGGQAHDCPCPPIEEWGDVSPYRPPTPAIDAYAARHVASWMRSRLGLRVTVHAAPLGYTGYSVIIENDTPNSVEFTSAAAAMRYTRETGRCPD